MGVNQAEQYGVTVQPFGGVISGRAWYQVVEVRHLTPAENQGNHHVYIDVVDVSGARVPEITIRAEWSDDAADGFSVTPADKPAGEPMANVPMYKNVVYAISVQGLASEVVKGLHIEHDDEAPGNTWGHHSFYIKFLCRGSGSDPGPPANPPVPPGGSSGDDPSGPPIPPEGGDASYWGFREHVFGQLHAAFYTLHALTLSRPELATAAAAGVLELADEISDHENTKALRATKTRKGVVR